ncbi:NAD(P)/FAD-dependent oxidoreductase [Bradyrhizobium guangxiense]|uniref:NAD(P)/FAD-dependent oxidoreductase n=1 Tax=Bradyrhizobium guangxiense TaxID=1325115 RepID=UPI0010089E97|nr:FAD-binding oxidoreductase [Bradyrhizobium guangxiense]
MASVKSAEVAIIGSGTIGIAVAYYLAKHHGITDIALIDQGPPMAFTSAQSGENYRNWWTHPLMVRLSDRSIQLMEDIARESGNRLNMTRRGYVLASRKTDASELIEGLRFSLGAEFDEQVRIHEGTTSRSYQRPADADWTLAPRGFDLLRNPELIQSLFPNYDRDLRTILHVRQAGDISGQQMGAFMLEYTGSVGAHRMQGMVDGIRAEREGGFTIAFKDEGTSKTLRAVKLINCAGPFANDIAAMLDVELPLFNVMQQKIAFEDVHKVIPRDMPFSIDLDDQMINWTEEEASLLRASADTAWLTQPMTGAIHCRPDGGDGGSWLRLGWAYNERAQVNATWDVPLDDRFPEIVLRGASRLNPGLRTYIGRLTRGLHHYSGWDTRTHDNWPLVGPMGPEGSYMCVGLSGFGTMMACAVGEQTAAWVADKPLPGSAVFTMDRFTDPSLIPDLGSVGAGLL